ncbi:MULTISPECIES: alpha-ketoglutarate-dependent dioxygenase AlkB family protein [unclassified Arthrobacter]|uniref:alpha-ketoglutarate-dependent dioxygenase AlkB family protein n=1 Tax=unclassified Arthrobacter TaxID=235627 RepID=UPI001D14A191|nr:MULTISPECIES: alpha-ketoglutarate-dependent dioxygenase AlkB [unclassified Arthrobacter]MCC3278599.1 alpha-ketoglutarate-dependent dioxygenase AlkB [Arthrobacter sp. zg-Y40]MCC9176966.1 alpha-ketoglutarate-dependent dioxygenase AlkB [Arthrobacter sp. zg-Y750]MDK1326322.1 alpha-ketoglutarate-dependent dioxygenase AlkB [Arthrobacter sp. zg-Y1143]
MSSSLFPRERSEPAVGAVHVPGWLPPGQQRSIVEACRQWAIGPVPMRSAVLPGGHPMSVQTVCLGWHWQPYKYTRTADDAGGGRVAELPDWLVQLGRDALKEAYRQADGSYAREDFRPENYTPDTALINYYAEGAHMGMHQDKDEKSSAPVVSISIGDTCVFRFGNTETRNRPYTDLELESGDLFVFGGPSRFAYHGVPRTVAGTADPESGLATGRINITLRMTGLSG